MNATPNKLVLVLAAMTLGACAMNGPEPVGAALETGASPLPQVGPAEWADAIAGCEGVLDGTESYAVSTSDGLVVALHGGHSFCVDSLEAVEDELSVIGLDDRVGALDQRYWATFDTHTLAADSSVSGPPAGEPNPQPSIQSTPPVRIITVIGPAEGEPNPQPSDPHADDATGTGGASQGGSSNVSTDDPAMPRP